MLGSNGANLRENFEKEMHKCFGVDFLGARQQ